MVLYAITSSGRQSDTPDFGVVFITIDALRADHLGCYGYDRETSPNIDRLAETGTRFEYAIPQWPKTSPSLASMMTGTYPGSNGVERLCGLRVPDGIDMLAEMLQREGFATAGVVTNRFAGSRSGFDRGFERFTEVWRLWPDNAERATDVALDWLADQNSEKPFFLWLHLLEPHAPYVPPEPFDGVFVGDRFDSDRGSVALSAGNQDIGAVPAHAQISGQDSVSHYVAQYDAEIRYVDSQIGRVIQALEERGLSSKTMVVLTADHGESLGDHNYYFEHGRLPYDSCLRVPLIIRDPWARLTPSTVEAPVALLNLVPTILEAVGAEATDQIQGVSMLPVVRGLSEELPEYVFSGAGYSQDYQRIVRFGRWKLISVPSRGDQKIMTGARFELYDVEADPDELKNLAGEMPELQRQLEEQLAKWTESTPKLYTTPPEVLPFDVTWTDALRALGYVEEVQASSS